MHHPKAKQEARDEAQQAKWRAGQEKQRREEAIATATALHVFSAIGSAVPVRLLKRDLLFIAEQLLSLMDEPRIEALARQPGIRQNRDDGGIQKTLTAYLRRADEGRLSRLPVEAKHPACSFARQCHDRPKGCSHSVQGGHRRHRH